MEILIVEDDVDLADQLAARLEDTGHKATIARDGISGLENALTGEFAVIVLDRMLPELDGLEVLARMREAGINTPTLILSALGQVDDRVEGLRAGGDDYLTKPYAFEELLARVEILARRENSTSEDTTLQVADLSLDRIAHTAARNGTDIPLQPREYRLLEYLMRHEGRIVTRSMLLQHVWGLNFDPQTNVIDVHVSRLRSKIDKDFEPALLHTIRGRGYRFGVSLEQS